MLIGTNLIQQQQNQNQQNNTENSNSNNPLNQVGLSNIINSNNLPDMLIQPLIEMGFDRYIYIVSLHKYKINIINQTELKQSMHCNKVNEIWVR